MFCFVSTCDQSRTFWNVLPLNLTFPSHHVLSSSPWWLHCVPVMWDGIPTGGLQESSVLHWEHWNWCCHELDHGPYGGSRWGKLWKIDNTSLLTALLTYHVLICLIDCRFLSPSGVARLQLWRRDHTHREPLWGAPGNDRLHGIQPRPGNQSTSSHGQD